MSPPVPGSPRPTTPSPVSVCLLTSASIHPGWLRARTLCARPAVRVTAEFTPAVSRSRHPRGQPRSHALEREQRPLDVERRLAPAPGRHAVAAERPVAGDHPVARDEQADRVAADRRRRPRARRRCGRCAGPPRRSSRSRPAGSSARPRAPAGPRPTGRRGRSGSSSRSTGSPARNAATRVARRDGAVSRAGPGRPASIGATDPRRRRSRSAAEPVVGRQHRHGDEAVRAGDDADGSPRAVGDREHERAGVLVIMQSIGKWLHASAASGRLREPCRTRSSASTRRRSSGGPAGRLGPWGSDGARATNHGASGTGGAEGPRTPSTVPRPL